MEDGEDIVLEVVRDVLAVESAVLLHRLVAEDPFHAWVWDRLKLVPSVKVASYSTNGFMAIFLYA